MRAADDVGGVYRGCGEAEVDCTDALQCAAGPHVFPNGCLPEGWEPSDDCNGAAAECAEQSTEDDCAQSEQAGSPPRRVAE